MPAGHPVSVSRDTGAAASAVGVAVPAKVSTLQRVWKRMLGRAAVRRRRVQRYLRRKLSWNRLYRTTSYLKSALWTVPLFAIVLVFATAPVLRYIDTWLD